MSDALRKVQSGQPLAIPASAYNAFIDAAVDLRQRTAHIGQDTRPASLQPGIVLVRNDSGSARARFEVLGIDSPVIAPTDNEVEFKNHVAFKGVMPAVASHTGRFVVLAEPIASGKIGRAFTAGVCPIKLVVPDETQDWRFAEIADGVTAHLEANSQGSAAILWRAGGTGVQWAIVRLGQPVSAQSVIFPVMLSQIGGAQGDGENPATWTYDVVDALSGEPLESAVNPVAAPHRWQRPSAGTMLPATFGYAHFQDDGEGGEDIVLGWINEMADLAVIDLTNLIRYDLASRQLQVNVDGTWTMITGGQAISLAEEL